MKRISRNAAATLVLSVSFALPALAQHGAHWTYEGADGPAHWGQLSPEYAACAAGKAQAPIDIVNAARASLPAITFNYHPSALRVIDNGHTIQVTPAPGSSITVAGKTYALKQFHFHHPSEEEIEGQPHAMVVHLVHADAYGKLAVVAVLVDTGAANSLIQEVWGHLPAKQKVERVEPNVMIDPNALLPTARGYITFAGSLTTPPCSEGVTWFVLKSPVEFSTDQVNAFAKLYPMNARPVQPVNGRAVKQTP